MFFFITESVLLTHKTLRIRFLSHSEILLELSVHLDLTILVYGLSLKVNPKLNPKLNLEKHMVDYGLNRTRTKETR